MPVPNFSPGEVLTANAMDQVGLWKVASGALSGTATNFAGCFPTDYTNFRIVVDQIALSAAPATLYWQLLDGTTAHTIEYRWAFLGISAGGVNQNSTQNSNQTAGFTGVTINTLAGAVVASFTMDVFNANVAQRTYCHTSAIALETSTTIRYGSTHNIAQTAFDGIRFLTDSATTVTGKVTVYGYRT
jgi:hypothetical protein